MGIQPHLFMYCLWLLVDTAESSSCCRDLSGPKAYKYLLCDPLSKSVLVWHERHRHEDGDLQPELGTRGQVLHATLEGRGGYRTKEKPLPCEVSRRHKA